MDETHAVTEGAVGENATPNISAGFWKQLAAFVLSVFGGIPATVTITIGTELPAFSVSDTVNIFGTQTKITMSSPGGSKTIVFTSTPS